MTPEQIAKLMEEGFMEEVEVAVKLIAATLEENDIPFLVGGAACAAMMDMIIAHNNAEASAQSGSVH